MVTVVSFAIHLAFLEFLQIAGVRREEGVVAVWWSDRGLLPWEE